jgi:hypothetical protein
VITASALERIAACPASAALPQVNSTSRHADRGTAIHDFLATAKRLGRDKALAAVPEGEWRDVCEAIDLDALPVVLMPEAAFVYDTVAGKARFLGSGLNRNYGPVAPHEIAGTADVVGIDGTRGYVADYFTGFAEMRKDAQLRFLALCLSLVHGLDEVVTEAIRIRPDGSPWVERKTLDALDLAQIAGEVSQLPALVQIAKSTIDTGIAPNVSEGPHCKYCPAVNSCPAKTALLRIAAGGGDVAAPFLQGGLTRDMAGAAYVLAEQLRGLAKELEKRVHGAVEEFGECPTPRGTVLKKVLAEGNERLSGDVTFEVVAERFGRDVADAAVERSATKSRLGAALKAAGLKVGPSSAEVLDEVRRRGGASRSVSEKLVEIDPAKGQAA